MDDRWSYEELRQEAHDLIDLATMLGPEGEGVDLRDRGYDSLELVVDLKNVLSSMWTAINVVNAGLAQVWAELGRNEQVEYEGVRYRLGKNKKVVYQEGQEEAFAAWLKEQDPELIARIVPAYGVRIGQVPGSARSTFFDEPVTDDQLRIQSRRV